MYEALAMNLKLTEIAESEQVLPGEGSSVEESRVTLGAALVALNALRIDGSLRTRIHLEFAHSDQPAVVISAARIVDIEGVCGATVPTPGSRYVYTFTAGSNYEAFRRFTYEARVHVHADSPLLH